MDQCSYSNLTSDINTPLGTQASSVLPYKRNTCTPRHCVPINSACYVANLPDYPVCTPTKFGDTYVYANTLKKGLRGSQGFLVSIQQGYPITERWYTMEQKEQNLFREAIRIFKQGDREQAHQLLRQVLIENPRYAPAWLWMSEFVETIEQKRDCLQRTLALDPSNEAARKGLHILRLQEASAKPPSPALYHIDHEQRRARRLGEYLIEHNLISHSQLEYALKEQRLTHSSLQGARVPLGDILIRLGMLSSPDKLATALLEQQQDRQGETDGHPPEYLGEYLTQKGIISHEQLGHILAEQIRLRQIGQKMMLGEMLISAGYITPSVLEKTLESQRADMFRRFGFTDDEEEEETTDPE